VVEAQHDPHRRGLARAVRTEEAGDDPWLYLEAQVVDGQRLAVALGEVWAVSSGQRNKLTQFLHWFKES
jgi:hypothetical protein